MNFTLYEADDSGKFNIGVDLSGVLLVEPIPTAPTVDTSILRVSPTMPNPSLDPATARPTADYEPTSILRQTWGRLQVVTGGKDYTYFRGAPVTVLEWSSVEPFGDEIMVVRLPQVTPFEQLGAGSLSDLRVGANIDLRLVRPDHSRKTLWAGLIMSAETHQDEKGCYLDLHCKGALFGVDNGLKQPSFDYRERDIGAVIAETFNRFRGSSHGQCQAVTTGIPTRQRGSWTPNVTGFVQDLLATATTATGDLWTVKQDYRTPKIAKKDLTTVHATLRTGTPGLSFDLSYDLSSAPNVIYGEGVSPDGQRWRNSKYPNFHPDSTPTFPLSTGSVFSPGSGTTGFRVFANELRENGYHTLVSGDTYATADVDEVRDAQKRAGITVDGIVGAQTWNAIFQTGSNVGDLTGSYYAPLAYSPAVEPWTYNARGGRIGKNPAYNPAVPRIERYENYGEGITKQEAIRSARNELARVASPGWAGTITLRIDPQQMSRFELRGGMNLQLINLHGTSPLLHIARASANPDGLSVTLTVDDHARDALTLAGVLSRDRDAATDPARRNIPQRRKSRQTQDDKILWDAESGAGILPKANLQGGFWSVFRIPGGQVGTVNRTVFTTSSPASKFVAAVFGSPVTAADMIRLVSAHPLSRTDPWSDYSDALVDAGFLVGWGDQDSAMGFYPKMQGDTGATVTGRFNEQSGWSYESFRPPWLWIAVYSNTSCKIAGQLYAEADA